MAHTAKHAARLISELEPCLPDGAERLLERPSYWDPGVFERFVERCESAIFHDPPFGLKLAVVAPRYARAIPAEDSATGRRETWGRLVRAYALLGSANRALGRFARAEIAYQQALRICRKRSVPAAAKADLYLKLAGLRACQRRFDEALQLVSDALEEYRTTGDSPGQALTLAVRGAIYVMARRLPEAVELLSEILGKYKLAPRVEYSVIGNLANAVAETDDPRNLKTAQAHLYRAQQLSGPRRTVKKAKLYWIEAKILMRHDPRRGESLWLKSLDTFKRFQAAYEIALVGLDIAALYRFQNRWPELEELASDVYEQFRKLRDDTESLAALKLWLDAVEARTLTEELLADVKAQIEARMPRVI